jgi:hypothetical protein
MFVAGLLTLVVVLAFSRWAYEHPGEALVRNTVRLSLAWYLAALCVRWRTPPRVWQTPAPDSAGSADASAVDAERSASRLRLARGFWTWAVVVFLVHLAMAFHFYHGWSHARAFERTRQMSGYGEGVYVSYLFTLAWCADAFWWWWNARSYGRRPAWVDAVLHAFMLFIVFNGTVVYETGPIRWAGLTGFLLLAGVWWGRARRIA